MKILNVLIIFWVLFISCTEQAPTQLLDDTTQQDELLDIEVLPREQDIYDYFTEYDSTGIFEPITEESSVIFANGIKNSFENLTIRQAYFSAIMIDKKKPIRHPMGSIIGYNSIAEGQVKFNNEVAKISERKIRMIANGISRDISAGYIFEIKKRYLLNLPSKFPYGSKINFEYKRSGMGNHSTSFDIFTPDEINGEIKISGSKKEKNLNLELKWNKLNQGKIQIIIGAIIANKFGIKPIFRIQTKDDGSISLPWSFLRTLQFSEIESLVVSFERTIKKSSNNSLIGENIVIAKSIHNIKFNIP